MRAVEPAAEVMPSVGAPMLVTRDGMINRSAIDTLSAPEPPDGRLAVARGGDRDKTDLMPLLLGSEDASDPLIESRCRFLSRVGMKPSLSRDKKRDESTDSSSSTLKAGLVR